MIRVEPPLWSGYPPRSVRRHRACLCADRTGPEEREALRWRRDRIWEKIRGLGSCNRGLVFSTGKDTSSFVTEEKGEAGDR